MPFPPPLEWQSLTSRFPSPLFFKNSVSLLRRFFFFFSPQCEFPQFPALPSAYGLCLGLLWSHIIFDFTPTLRIGVFFFLYVDWVALSFFLARGFSPSPDSHKVFFPSHCLLQTSPSPRFPFPPGPPELTRTLLFIISDTRFLNKRF